MHILITLRCVIIFVRPLLVKVAGSATVSKCRISPQSPKMHFWVVTAEDTARSMHHVHVFAYKSM